MKNFNPYKVDTFGASPFRVSAKTRKPGSKNSLKTNRKLNKKRIIKINKNSKKLKTTLEKLDSVRREIAIEIIDYLEKHSFSDVRTMSEGLFAIRISQRKLRVPYYNKYHKKTLTRPVTVSEIEKIANLLLEKK